MKEGDLPDLSDCFYCAWGCQVSKELVVGVIDYMRQYDIIKRMERVGKSVGMIAGQVRSKKRREPPILPPSAFSGRITNRFSILWVVILSLFPSLPVY